MSSGPWSEQEWHRVNAQAAAVALAAPTEKAQRARIVLFARRVLHTYSSSFFTVTRFLPRAHREQVEILYANVRYPDEVVDTLPLSPARKQETLDAWERWYERGLEAPSLDAALRAGVPAFLAAFTAWVRRSQVPPDYYRSFMEAMRLDVCPRVFADLEDLIASYVYGSAIVVGYLLTYIFGASAPGKFPDALESARQLGIALQLTNFARDVGEDLKRGRCYVPRDILAAEGIPDADRIGPPHHPALRRAVLRLCSEAEAHYAAAAAGVEAFSPETRSAIEACIRVYRLLNDRVTASDDSLERRVSVPLLEKLRPLPPSKYWRIPWAYLTGR
ncbi:MAG: phytoene/squalene synthase family protein [Armatimonadota bacterium]|nr:phytoene/squalene synthase family protein [Armatimonadota bacterium]